MLIKEVSEKYPDLEIIPYVKGDEIGIGSHFRFNDMETIALKYMKLFDYYYVGYYTESMGEPAWTCVSRSDLVKDAESLIFDSFMGKTLKTDEKLSEKIRLRVKRVNLQKKIAIIDEKLKELDTHVWGYIDYTKSKEFFWV